MLQLFDFSKKGENFLKGRGQCKGIHGISSVPAREYRERYLRAMADLFVAVDESGEVVPAQEGVGVRVRVRNLHMMCCKS